MTIPITWVRHQGWSILRQFSKLQGVVNYTHTSLTKFVEFFHFSFPQISREEPIKEGYFEDIPGHQTTS